MENDVIPEDARQFLLLNIDSIAQWEGLLLLREHPKKKWDPHTASRSLYVSEQATEELLAGLAARMLVEVVKSPDGPLYRYRPASAELDKMVGRVAELYRRYLIPITHIIHSKSKNRVQEFANAFRIRKD